MDFSTYLLSVMIVSIGLLFGSSLAHISRSEVHQFKKHLPGLQMFCVILLFLVLFSFFPFLVALSMLFLSFGFVYLFWRKLDMNFLDYIVFGGLFALTSVNLLAHFYVSLILFVFGMFSGSLFYVLHTFPQEHLKKTKSTSKKSKLPHGSHVLHHKHKGRHHTSQEIFRLLVKKYAFFPLLALVSYGVANIAWFLFF
jgi:hypothetical protein